MDIQLTRGDRVAVVTINRPHDENRLTRDALDRLHEIAQTLCSDQETLAIIITGAGDQFFSAGMLHPKVRATLSKEEILDMVRAANAAYDQIEALPQIVIAALNGITRAGAAEMTLACDIRLAADHATFAIPEAKWGGFPGAGAPVRLPGILGAARALELICTGRELTAPEMERYGLVQRVVPRQELMSVAHALAGGIATCGPLAIRGAKRIVRLSQRAGFTAARELSDALRSALESTSDMAEGQAAFSKAARRASPGGERKRREEGCDRSAARLLSLLKISTRLGSTGEFRGPAVPSYLSGRCAYCPYGLAGDKQGDAERRRCPCHDQRYDGFGRTCARWPAPQGALLKPSTSVPTSSSPMRLDATARALCAKRFAERLVKERGGERRFDATVRTAPNPVVAD